MARVPHLEPSDLSAENQGLLKRPITRTFIRFGSGRLRELAILQVGRLARLPYG